MALYQHRLIDVTVLYGTCASRLNKFGWLYSTALVYVCKSDASAALNFKAIHFGTNRKRVCNFPSLSQ